LTRTTNPTTIRLAPLKWLSVYVKQLRELDPENAAYAQLAARIEGRPAQ
jgi:hypothetical protein